MGRGPVKLEPIVERAKRHTTFTKRRTGLFKKTEDLCKLCGAEAAVITFSKAGNLFVHAHPDVDTIIERYIAAAAAAADNSTSLDSIIEQEIEIEARDDTDSIEEDEKLEEATSSLTEIEKIIVEAMGKDRSIWESAIGELGLGQLDDLAAAMEKIKGDVAAQVVAGNIQ